MELFFAFCRRFLVNENFELFWEENFFFFSNSSYIKAHNLISVSKLMQWVPVLDLQLL